MTEMTDILVIGGAGFIGRRTAVMLQAQGLRPKIFDLPRSLERATLPQGCTQVAGDVTDPASILAAAQGCGGIVHLAGIMTLDCAKDPTRAVTLNVQGGINVFEVARTLALPVAYLSTAGVYGPSDAVHPQPMSIYGVTKLALEGIARVYAGDHGVPSLGLRPYIVYGPGESSGVAAGPSIALRASVRREPAVIRFSGRSGFVHCDDVGRLLAGAMAAGVAGKMTGASVLTMAGDTRDMEDFLSILRQRTGWDQISVDGPALKIPSDLASHPVPDWLGPQPVTSLEDGIDRTLATLRGGL